jgi:hypothetical protein
MIEWNSTVATPGTGCASCCSVQSTASAWSRVAGNIACHRDRTVEFLESLGLIRPDIREERESSLIVGLNGPEIAAAAFLDHDRIGKGLTKIQSGAAPDLEQTQR